MLLKVGSFYMDGNGNVHGPMRLHPSQPTHYMISTGSTFYRDGRHTSGDITPAHAALNLVVEVMVTPMPAAIKCEACDGKGYELDVEGMPTDCSKCYGDTVVISPGVPLNEYYLKVMPDGSPRILKEPERRWRDSPGQDPVGSVGPGTPGKDPEGDPPSEPDNPIDCASDEWYEIFKTVLVGAALGDLGLEVRAAYVPPDRIIERAEKLADLGAAVYRKHQASIEPTLRTLYKP